MYPEKTADILQRHHWFSREMTSEERAQKFHIDDAHYPDLGSAFDWFVNLPQPIRSTTQIWVVTVHQYRIFALVPQTSFRGKISANGIAKCRLFSQASRNSDIYVSSSEVAGQTLNFFI